MLCNIYTKFIRPESKNTLNYCSTISMKWNNVSLKLNQCHSVCQELCFIWPFFKTLGLSSFALLTNTKLIACFQLMHVSTCCTSSLNHPVFIHASYIRFISYAAKAKCLDTHSKAFVSYFIYQIPQSTNLLFWWQLWTVLRSSV